MQPTEGSKLSLKKRIELLETHEDSFPKYMVKYTDGSAFTVYGSELITLFAERGEAQQIQFDASNQAALNYLKFAKQLAHPASNRRIEDFE